MANKTNAILQDSGMERSILAGITSNGVDCFFDVEEIIIDVQTFYWKQNQELFKILSHLVHKEEAKTFDIPSIQAAAKMLGYNNFANEGKYSEYLEAIMADNGPSRENIPTLVAAIFKLYFARQGYVVADSIQKVLSKVTGTEDIDDIIGQIEGPVFDLTGKIMTQGVGLTPLGQRCEQIITTLLATPQDIVGLPTGFPHWDMAIGGGLRPATVNVVGARPKQGKCVDSHNTAIITENGVLMPYGIFHVKWEWGLRHRVDTKLLNERGKLVQPEYGWVNGYSDVIRIRTKYGATLSATYNHPVRVLGTDGKIIWKNAEDLIIGDYVVSRRGDRCWGSENLPIDDAYTIGLLVGDGCINDRIVDMSSLDQVCREMFEAFIERQGGTVGTNNDKSLRCNIVATAKQVYNLGFYDEKRFKIFPKSVRMANEQSVCAALSGYFDADGTVERHGITATTNSLKLAVQLRAILLNLGILSKTRQRMIVPPGHTTLRLYWELAIQNVESARLFRDFIGFRIKRKRHALDQFCQRRSSTKQDVVPNLHEHLRSLRLEITKDRGYFLPKDCNDRSNLENNINCWIRRSRRPRRDVVRKLLDKLQDYSHLKAYQAIQELADQSLLFDPVKQLVPDKAWTCDFYIQDGHSFITNGIISHNSFFCINVAKNMAQNGIPVLYLDTELTRDVQLLRLVSSVSAVSLNNVERGLVNEYEEKALKSCAKQVESLPITHLSVAGCSPQTIISFARRWLSRTVGFTNSGMAKPCVIIYDYLKLMDDDGFKKNLQEYQLLGFLMTSLHNFAVKFNLPVLATVQLNRDGVEKEGAEVVSGSDRIVWLCSNFTILKKKTPTELTEDPPSNGTKKLIVTDTRFGPGMESGEYINVVDQLATGTLLEGKPFSAITQAILAGQLE